MTRFDESDRMRTRAQKAEAEIERLRPYEKVAADLQACGAYVGIGPGEGDLPIPERVRRTVNRLKGSVHRYEQKILSKDVQIRSLKIEETNLTGQIEQLGAEIERLEVRIAAYQQVGRAPLEHCHEVQQKLRDRLDRISAYAHEHGALWKNGDGTDDIIIAHAEHQDTVIKRLQEANTNFACQASDQAQEIEMLMAENARLAKMFADDVYIESASMEPGYYDITTRGKGAMLLVGQLLQFFRSSGGKNFLTNQFQMEFGDSKTSESFELTIQKINGENSPVQKLQRQAAMIEDISIKYQNALDDVKNLEEQIETFHLRRGNELRQMNEISLRNKEQAARIKDLEHQLDTRSQEITGRIQECHACQAEGKLGNCDHIVEPDQMGWQVTEERKNALERSAEIFEEDANELEGEEYSGAWAARQKSLEIATVLRGMLAEATR